MEYTDQIRNYIRLLEAQNKEELKLAKLPYATDALGPVMGEETVDIHYNKLTKGYFKNIEKGPYFEAGAFLHNLWWENLQPPTNNNGPIDKVADLINDKFSSFVQFKKEFTEAATTIQGNGWCVLTTSGKIVIISNHKKRKDIALLLDMWEHAFFLDFSADKAKYVNNFWKIINWDVVNLRL